MLFNGDRMSCSLQTETNLNTRYLSGLSENQRMTVLLRFLLNTLKKMECVDQGLEYLEYIWVWVLLVVTGYTLAVLIRNIYIYIYLFSFFLFYILFSDSLYWHSGLIGCLYYDWVTCLPRMVLGMSEFSIAVFMD